MLLRISIFDTMSGFGLTHFPNQQDQDGGYAENADTHFPVERNVSCLATSPSASKPWLANSSDSRSKESVAKGQSVSVSLPVLRKSLQCLNFYRTKRKMDFPIVLLVFTFQIRTVLIKEPFHLISTKPCLNHTLGILDLELLHRRVTMSRGPRLRTRAAVNGVGKVEELRHYLNRPTKPQKPG
jgi:hypothetical protein